MPNRIKVNLKKTQLLVLLLLLGASASFGQQKQWLFLSDKGPEQSFWAAHPEGLLSEKARERRAQAGNAIGVQDYPISTAYLKKLTDAGLEITGSSKWLNAVSVKTDMDLASVQTICPEVVAMKQVAGFSNTAFHDIDLRKKKKGKKKDKTVLRTNTFDYGSAQTQTEILNLNCLHDRGFTGANVLIAVFDAGFYGMDTIKAFDSLRLQGRLHSYYDFVNGDTTVFDENNHGMNVASCIVANLPGQYLGTAPHAMVALARTENVFSETHQEEDNWLMAVEWADSLGADIIQSSLGYTTFDQGEGDFTYSDLDGNTTVVALAADLAAKRGILVVNSAGNEGNGSWRHISSPCDGDSVLCVGAVTSSLSPASFSGVGPSADGQTKPDVAAMGQGASVIGTDGEPGFASGTSFSAPQMAGFAACLRGAHPDRTNMEVISAIRRSGTQFVTPDTLIGYGIPDACKADSILDFMDSLALAATHPVSISNAIQIAPNPAQDRLTITNTHKKVDIARIEIVSMEGKTHYKRNGIGRNRISKQVDVPISKLAPGVYFLHLNLSDGQFVSKKFVKQ